MKPRHDASRWLRQLIRLFKFMKKRLTNAALKGKIRWLAGRINGLDKKKEPLLQKYTALTDEADKRRANGRYKI